MGCRFESDGGHSIGRNHYGSDVFVSRLLAIVWVICGELCGSKAKLCLCKTTAGCIPRSGSCVTAARTRITCGEENRNDRRQAHWQGEIGPDTGSSHRGPRESRSARIRGRRRGNDTEGETLPKPAPIMSEAMTKWNEMWNVSDGTMDRTRSVIKNDIQGDFGDLPVSKVSQGDIETLLASRPSA